MPEPILYSIPPICAETEIDFSVHPWMDVICRELGVREIPGRRDNPRILEYATATDDHLLHDEDAWCSTCANWTLQQAGYLGTRSARARTWLNYGIPLTEPRYGCISVFWRDDPKGPFGHVFFYLRDGGIADLWGIGGNHDNEVKGKAYPRVRLLAHRWPVPARG